MIEMMRYTMMEYASQRLAFNFDIARRYAEQLTLQSLYTTRNRGKYVLIDSLSQNDCLRFVALDIQTRKIDFQIDNQILTFTQENELDTTQMFEEQRLICRLENENIIVLKISEILQVDNDSIFVSATYQKFNKRGNIGKAKKIEKLGVCKSELSGVMISPPTKEIRKKRNGFAWFIGGIAVTITALSIIFGGT
jgi:hypothetical protein